MIYVSIFYRLLSVLCYTARIWYVLFFLSAASNTFPKDHEREEAQGASNTSTLEAVEPTASGSRSSISAQPES